MTEERFCRPPKFGKGGRVFRENIWVLEVSGSLSLRHLPGGIDPLPFRHLPEGRGGWGDTEVTIVLHDTVLIHLYIYE